MTDPLTSFFLICFLVGAALVLLMSVTGLWATSLHLGPWHANVSTLHAAGGHLAVGHGHAMGAGHAGSGSVGARGASAQAPAHGAAHVSPFNTISVLTFLTWFGGVGYILRTQSAVVAWLSIVAAIVIAAAAAWVIFLFLARVLLPHQTILDPADYELTGTVARTTTTIRPGGTGEVMFTKAGSRRVEAARSDRGEEIAHGTEVVIVRYERGIAYVDPWDEFVARSSERRRPA